MTFLCHYRLGNAIGKKTKSGWRQATEAETKHKKEEKAQESSVCEATKKEATLARRR